MSDDGINLTIEGDDGSHAVASRRQSEPTPTITSTEELSRVRAERDHMRSIAFQSRRETLEAHHAATQREADAAELEYKTAYESGDSDGMIAAQRKMSRAEAASIHTEQMRAELERTAQAYQSSAPSDPVEAFAQGRTARTADWVRRHPDYITDSRKHAKLQAAHYDAVANGHPLDSDGYFSAVEKFIGGDSVGRSSTRAEQRKTFYPPQKLEDGTTVYRVRKGEQAPDGSVHMTPGEYKAATDTITWTHNDPKGKFKAGDPIGCAEYLRRKKAMQEQGYFDRLSDLDR
jgi:hypothetical protein